MVTSILVNKDGVHGTLEKRRELAIVGRFFFVMFRYNTALWDLHIECRVHGLMQEPRGRRGREQEGEDKKRKNVLEEFRSHA